MASKEETIIFILDQIKNAGNVSAKKIFGEYAVYCDNKVVALVCDDMFYIKPTVSGKKIIGEIDEKTSLPWGKKLLPYLWRYLGRF